MENLLTLIFLERIMIHWIFKKGFRYNKTRSLPGKQKRKFAGQKKQCIDCKESFYRSDYPAKIKGWIIHFC